jgi:hypothetical protein
MRPFRVDIEELIQAANKPGHNHRIVKIGEPTAWLIDAAQENAVYIEGFDHIVDTSAIRHILDRHGNEKEKARGGVQLTHEDIHSIPEIVSSPDQVAFGASTKQGRPLIAYIKPFKSGSILLLEEVRSKTLALKTMRKYPATINVLSNVDLYVRNDGRTSLKIVSFAKKST